MLLPLTILHLKYTAFVSLLTSLWIIYLYLFDTSHQAEKSITKLSLVLINPHYLS